MTFRCAASLRLLKYMANSEKILQATSLCCFASLLDISNWASL